MENLRTLLRAYCACVSSLVGRAIQMAASPPLNFCKTTICAQSRGFLDLGAPIPR